MTRQKMKKTVKKRKAIQKHRKDAPRCGLCGATSNLIKTECCGQWICDDESEYVMFSYAHNSCSRNHRRYTLCGHHFAEGHDGDWKTCQKCKDNIEPEMYAYFGTNEYNFEKLENPPDYEPTKCHKCGVVISLAEDAYARSSDGYLCDKCMAIAHPDLYGG